MKSLVAYFSRAGGNYAGGNIVNLSRGNTEIIANKIKEFTNGDIFQIRTPNPYPDDYRKTVEIAKEELNNDLRPELAEMLDSINDYDTIYVGYPNWCGTMPMAVFKFLESYDFSGKTIVPFCTHEGSGFGGSIYDIQRLCPDSKILEGIAVRGSDAGSPDAHKKVELYLKEEGLINYDLQKTSE